MHFDDRVADRRPIPIPSGFVVKKASKIWPTFDALSPVPVSATAIDTSPGPTIRELTRNTVGYACLRSWPRSRLRPGSRGPAASGLAWWIWPRLACGQRCGDRSCSDRVSGHHTGVEPPAAIRLRHRVSNLIERPPLGKASLPLGDVRNVVSEERDRPTFADYSRSRSAPEDDAGARFHPYRSSSRIACWRVTTRYQQ
jgi:hypothetical protein